MPAYKDPKLGTWYVKFRYKDWNGDIKWMTKRSFPTKREATQWEWDFKLQKSGDISMKFADLITNYEESIRPRIKESTWETKSNIIESKILPYFCDKRTCDIKALDVLHWQNELLKYRDSSGKPYASSYLKTVHNQLSAIFNYAVCFHELKSNPARSVGNMGSEKGIVMQFWTAEEYAQFSETMMDSPQAYYCFEMLYWCGIREGELLALTQEDFDFESGTVSITKTYHRSYGRDIITDPKTPKSRRTVSMPDFLCAEMQDYFSMVFSPVPTKRAFPFTKSFLNYQIKIGAAKAGVKRICVHSLRHSHVSLLINMGFSAVAIADRLGHESIDITYRYAHLFPSVQNDMALRLNELRGGLNNVAQETGQ